MSTQVYEGPRLEELQAAARALAAGHFRAGPATATGPVDAAEHAGVAPQPKWTPTRRVLPVVGAHGSSGATSVAVAIATVAAPARVVECCSMSETGLAEAPTAELGTDEHGWIIGDRDQVRLMHSSQMMTSPAAVPVPSVSDGPGVDLLDVAWALPHVLASGGWIEEQVRFASCVVVTAVATVPSLRRLENVIGALPGTTTAVAVVRSKGRRRWSGAVRAAMGPLTRRCVESGNWVELPPEKDLAERGLTGEMPLPRSLLDAAQRIAALTGAGATTQKEITS